MSNHHFSYLKRPSINASPAHVGQSFTDYSATGAAFLAQMTRGRQIQHNTSSGATFASTETASTGFGGNGGSGAKENTSETGTPITRGSMPSIPSSVLYPVTASNTHDPPRNKRPAASKRSMKPSTPSVQRPVPKKGANLEVAAEFSPMNSNSSLEGATLTTFRGHAAFAAVANLSIITPSSVLKLRCENDRITTTFSGFLSSHPFDDALEQRVEANRKALGQEMLGEKVSSKILLAVAVSIGKLEKKETGRIAIIRSRLVQVVLDHLDYGPIEHIMAEVRTTPDQFVEVKLHGLKWGVMKKLAMELINEFQEAFSAAGKMTAEEQKYYDDMPMLGIEGAFDDSEDEEGNDMQDDQVRTHTANSGLHGSPSAMDVDHAGDQSLKQTLPDSPMEYDDELSAEPLTVNDDESTPMEGILPSLDVTTTEPPAKPKLIPSMAVLKKARDNDDWKKVTVAALRAFLEDVGDYHDACTRKPALIEAAKAHIDQTAPENDEHAVEAAPVPSSARPKIKLSLRNKHAAKNKAALKAEDAPRHVNGQDIDEEDAEVGPCKSGGSEAVW